MIKILKQIVVNKSLTSKQIRGEMEQIGVDPRGIEIMVDKFEHFIIKLFGLSFRQAAIIKQEMLAKGGEAAVSWKVSSWQENNKDNLHELLLTGTWRQLRQLIVLLKQQPFGLAEIAERIEAAVLNYQQKPKTINLRGKSFDLSKRTLVMGIINITPDSFSKDGLLKEENYIDSALKQARQMIADGADILDLGAESTRPGTVNNALGSSLDSELLDEGEELRRLLPVLKELVQAVDVPISVDTYKPGVAEQALNIGATIINDIWGLQSPHDPERKMAKLVGESKAPVIIMHNQSQPGYRFLMKEIIDWLAQSIEIALEYGASTGQIIVDPGIGFGKTLADNLKTLQNLEDLKVLGCPVLLGTSRKSVIGKILDLPVEERLEGTIATTIWGMAKGANIIRVHDVKAIARAVRMGDAIIQS